MTRAEVLQIDTAAQMLTLVDDTPWNPASTIARMLYPLSR